MATTEKMPSVREHADAMIDKLIAERPPTVDLESARQAAAVPTFSAGTAALDRDGKPIIKKDQAKVPEFTEGSVAIPEGSETQGGAPAGHSKEELLAAHQARIDAKAPSEVIEAAPAESVVGQEQSTQAAEAVAEAIADRFAEYDEFEFDDPDLEMKIPVRVPKQYSETAKRGYGRRAALDRAIRYAKEADPTLRPLIENGQLKDILPILQFALSNKEYGEAVATMFQRAQNGLPLIEQAKLEAAAPPPQAAPVDFGLEDDPFFAERVRPLTQRLESFEQRFAREDADREQATQRQQQQAQQNAFRDRQLMEAHQDLAASFPGLFRLDLGPNDPNFRKALHQAKEANYAQRGYDLKASVFFGGQLVSQIEAERLATTGSPTADALREAEMQHGELARREARAAAQTVGKGAITAAPPKPQLPPPSSRRADGTLKKPDEYLRDQQAYMASAR